MEPPASSRDPVEEYLASARSRLDERGFILHDAVEDPGGAFGLIAHQRVRASSTGTNRRWTGMNQIWLFFARAELGSESDLRTYSRRCFERCVEMRRIPGLPTGITLLAPIMVTTDPAPSGTEIVRRSKPATHPGTYEIAGLVDARAMTLSITERTPFYGAMFAKARRKIVRELAEP